MASAAKQTPASIATTSKHRHGERCEATPRLYSNNIEATVIASAAKQTHAPNCIYIEATPRPTVIASAAKQFSTQ